MVGASGAIFGVFGALAVHAYLNRGRDFQSAAFLQADPLHASSSTWSSRSSFGGISWQAHIGGLVGGAATMAAMMLGRPQGPAPPVRAAATGWPCSAIVLVLVALTGVARVHRHRADAARVTEGRGPQLVQPGAALGAGGGAGRAASPACRPASRARGLDAALLQQNADLFYFAGTVQQSYLYVPAEGEATLFVRKVAERARLESRARRDRRPAVAQGPAGGSSPSATARCPRALGLELDVLPVAAFRRLERLFPGAAFEDVGPAIVRQRAVKSAWEVERIRAAAAVADEVSRLIPGLLEEGLTEVEFAGRVEAEARRLGPRGLHPHARLQPGDVLRPAAHRRRAACVPSYLDTPLAGTGLSPSVAQGVSFRRIGRGEPVVFDFVPVRDGYMADFTRMYSLGPLHGELLRAYDAALRVQEAATAAARPGRGLPRRVGGRAGGRRGRGPGRQLHGPRRRPGAATSGTASASSSTSCRCSPAATSSSSQGMVFALEPKFVLPGLGAIGIENTWVVTARRRRAAHACAGGHRRRRLTAPPSGWNAGAAGRVSVPVRSEERGTHGAAGAGRLDARHRCRGVPDALARSS